MSFCLDAKERKNQENMMLHPTWPELARHIFYPPHSVIKIFTSKIFLHNLCQFLDWECDGVVEFAAQWLRDRSLDFGEDSALSSLFDF